MSRILIVDDEPSILSTLKLGLEKVGHSVVTAGTAEDGLASLRRSAPDVAILDVMLPDGNGLDVLKKVRELDDQLPVIFITGADDSTTAIEAMKRGALDYLVKPLVLAAIREAVDRAAEIRALTRKQVEIDPAGSVSDRQAIIGKCPAMQEVYKAIGIVASQNVTVLIRGESGTGKELVARALFQHGERSRAPFLAVNCAAIPENLLESELFGHEKGAFTGADRKRIGKFEQCAGGTLFLDEIGDMTPILQSKLLRVLQEQQFERVGGNETVATNVRVIAATNRNLEQMVADKEFRADLYYRLNGFSIHLPPLCERGGDLELLIEYFCRVFSSELDKQIIAVSPESMAILCNYAWPGNIRELQNAIRQALLKATGNVLLPRFLPEFVRKPSGYQTTENSVENGALEQLIEKKFSAGSECLYDEVVGNVEERLVERVLSLTQGDKSAAIRKLGVNPTVFRSPAALELLHLESIAQDGNGSVIKPGMTMEEIEKQAIQQALEQSKGVRKEAAEMLGISVRTMQRKIKEHAIDV